MDELLPGQGHEGTTRGCKGACVCVVCVYVCVVCVCVMCVCCVCCVCGGGGGGGGARDTESKTRTPHKDVGNKHRSKEKIPFLFFSADIILLVFLCSKSFDGRSEIGGIKP